jgi:hypothetical protein
MLTELLVFLVVSVPGTWHWDASVGADGYEFCWSHDPLQWSRALCTDVGPNTAFLPSIELDLAVWSLPEGRALFFQVCAYKHPPDSPRVYDEDCAPFAAAPADWACQAGTCP